MIVQKVGNASTLDVISKVKETIARTAPSLPAALNIKPLADQSLFVRASIQGVLREAVIAACLTALMILVFLGSWRSTIIIAVSIPLSILSSIIVLSALGETINIMTLGGLALAVGILVDDATVAIENINAHLEAGKELEPAILDGAQQIAIPAFVSTLCICIVFVPMFFLTGVARYLFVPMAEAVVFAMLASYVLSRTLVPTMAKYLLKAHTGSQAGLVRSAVRARARRVPRPARIRRRPARHLRRRSFSRSASGVAGARPLGRRGLLSRGRQRPVQAASARADRHAHRGDGGALRSRAGRDPRGHSERGNRQRHRQHRAALQRHQPVVHELGADRLVGRGHPRRARRRSSARPTGTSTTCGCGSPNEFPGVLFSFIPADIVTQILNFGLPAPIDVQVVGRNLEANRQFASKLATRLAQVPGMVDLRVHQAFNQPLLHLDVDRTRAVQTGFTQRDVANNLLISLSGSSQTTPTFWLNPATGVSYTRGDADAAVPRRLARRASATFR